MSSIEVRDTRTQKVYSFRAADTHAVVDTEDGERLFFHPYVIKNMVKLKEKFTAKGRIRDREMIRIR